MDQWTKWSDEVSLSSADNITRVSGRGPCLRGRRHSPSALDVVVLVAAAARAAAFEKAKLKPFSIKNLFFINFETPYAFHKLVGQPRVSLRVPTSTTTRYAPDLGLLSAAYTSNPVS